MRVTLPLIAPGLGAAFALVFISSATELTATLLLRPTGVNTLATQFWAYTDGLLLRRGRALRGADGGDLGRARLPAQPPHDDDLRSAERGAMSRLRVEGLWKGYRGHGGAARRRPRGASAGSLTAVLGLSGCGKTTLLRVIAGFERAERGSVSLGATTLDDGRSYVAPEKRGIGYVPQEGALFPHLTVEDNVGFGLPAPRAPRRRRRRAAGDGRDRARSPSACRTSSPAASSSASRSRGRWRAGRRCCCSTSRSPRSTPRCAGTCARRSTGCCASRA